jgi:hypothetical protein
MQDRSYMFGNNQYVVNSARNLVGNPPADVSPILAFSRYI